MSSLPPDPFLLRSEVPAWPDSLPWWPRADLPLALSRMAGRPFDAILPQDPADLDDWMAWACERLGLRRDHAPVALSEAESALGQAAPAILWHPSRAWFLLLVRRGVVVGPDGTPHRADRATLARAVLPPAHPSVLRQGRRLAALVGGGSDLVQALARIDRGSGTAEGVWRFRRAAGASAGAALRAGGVPILAALALACAVLLQGAEVALWSLLGGAVLAEKGPPVWLVVPALAVLPILQLASGLASDGLSRRISVLLRRRVLAGALSLEAGAADADGPEGMLARGLEAQAAEAALAGLAMAAPLALAAVGWAVWVLAIGPGGGVLVPLFLAVLCGQALAFRRYQCAAAEWTEARRGLTARMVGWMIGHRSLPLLGTPDAALRGEAPHLGRFAAVSRAMDRRSLLAFAVAPNGWALAALATVWLVAPQADETGMAIMVGGIILAARALVAVSATWAALGAWRIASRQVAPLLRTFGRGAEPAFPAVPPTGDPRLALSSVRIERSERGLALDVSLQVAPGARMRLDGPSGTGKSSLLRRMAEGDTSGRILTGAQPLPARHTARVLALVPQFQDNHVFDGSFAFNLLLARGWPPRAADLADAEAVAHDLGLGPLIDRMPGGLSTHLGETGWQLSQGERSRLFLARAVLQRAPVVALDESLSALDPATETECLAALDRHVDGLIVVRHD